MKKVAIQITNIANGITQSGVFCEEVEKDFELRNALAHFGFICYELMFSINKDNTFIYSGKVTHSQIYFTAIIYEVQKQA